MKGYELCIIFQPDTSDAVMDELFGTLGDAIVKYNGSIVKTEKWGKRNLKFPIRKQTKGNFCFIFFYGTAEALKDIDRIARYNEQILRYNVMRNEKDLIRAAAESEAEEAASAEPAAEAAKAATPAAQEAGAAENVTE